MNTIASESDKKDPAPSSFSPVDEPKEAGAAAVSDDVSVREEKEATIKEELLETTLKRQSELQYHVYRLSNLGVYLIFAITVFAIAIWFWHIVGPESYHWLGEENFNKLQNVLFGALVGGAANQYSKKIFGD